MKDVRKILGVKIESPYWDEAFGKAQSEPVIPSWMTKEHIHSLHSDCGLLSDNIEAILSAASLISKNPELCLLAKILAHIIATKKTFEEAFTEFELPRAPEGTENTIGYDCFAVFPIIANLKPTWDELVARGMPEAFISAGLFWVDCFMSEATEQMGKPAFTDKYFKMYPITVYINQFILKRLRFEIHPASDRPVRIFRNRNGRICILMDKVYLHKSGHILGSFGCSDEDDSYFADFVETDSTYEGYAVDEITRLAQNVRTVLLKKEWEPVFVPGDDVIKVHIPYTGKLTNEACEEAFELAESLLPRCFPEYDFKGFLLGCWMLSPLLREILPAESNIIKFQNRYEIFPMKSNAADAFLYVFGIDGIPVGDIDCESLPESTALMRGIRKNALENKFVHQFNGFIPR